MPMATLPPGHLILLPLHLLLLFAGPRLGLPVPVVLLAVHPILLILQVDGGVSQR